MKNEFVNQANNPACALSLGRANLTSSFELHFAPQKELDAHGGICKACATKIKKRAKLLHGKIEAPAELTIHRHELSEEDHAGFVAPGEITQTVDFDFDSVDEALGFIQAAPKSARQEAGELVRKIFSFCFEAQGKNSLRTAAAKFAVIAGGLRPDLLNDQTQTVMAAQLNLTKASLSKMSLKFQSKFGVKFSRSRSAEARRSMSLARLGKKSNNRKAKEIAS